jgi:DNA-directed RNA polymerase subunit K/omega
MSLNKENDELSELEEVDDEELVSESESEIDNDSEYDTDGEQKPANEKINENDTDDEDFDNEDDEFDNDEDMDDEMPNTNTIKTNVPMDETDPDEDDDDDDDDEDPNYLQKFDENIQNNVIAEFHPELKSLNYDEIEALTVITRDENGIIIDPLHKTIPFVTRYEKSRVLGERAKQIDAGGQIFVEVDPDIIDGSVIAMKEFFAKKIPFIIQRPLPNGGAEYWKLKDLEIIDYVN